MKRFIQLRAIEKMAKNLKRGRIARIKIRVTKKEINKFHPKNEKPKRKRHKFNTIRPKYSLRKRNVNPRPEYSIL